MGKFFVLEEGRLDKSEMQQLTGGNTFMCVVPSKHYRIIYNCISGPSYSLCKSYISCINNGGNVTCRPYKGATGPAGSGSTLPIFGFDPDIQDRE